MLVKKLRFIYPSFVWLWILFAFIALLFNFLKTFSDAHDWLFATDTEKKEKTFGEKYDFVRFVESKTQTSQNLTLWSNDDMVYYLLRYYLYPQRVYFNTDNNYIAVSYNKTLSVPFYKIASFSGKRSTVYGYIYIKK
jgi:hypothetical protein